MPKQELEMGHYRRYYADVPVYVAFINSNGTQGSCTDTSLLQCADNT